MKIPNKQKAKSSMRRNQQPQNRTKSETGQSINHGRQQQSQLKARFSIPLANPCIEECADNSVSQGSENPDYFTAHMHKNNRIGRRLSAVDADSRISYQFQASTMPMKSAAASEAPPIRPPSTSGFANKALAFEGLQLPP